MNSIVNTICYWIYKNSILSLMVCMKLPQSFIQRLLLNVSVITCGHLQGVHVAQRLYTFKI